MDQNTSLVGPYVEDYKLTFPNLLDPSGKVYPIFGVRYTPTNYLINRKGEVVGRTLGYRDWDTPQVYGIIERLLAEKVSLKKDKKIARN